ncbi:hypothetical protein CYV15_02640 [Riemerella anatipestifer]|uniref:hypothetical protein n=1 Tax=Riemerella anatipestifer TaxID=34085 RepID=UPI000D14164E|nr:hypothetical protein [Riemerella anatipestifer]PST44621.1 hypothetical protein CYV15_02640 [Riemerella anatipestifer]
MKTLFILSFILLLLPLEFFKSTVKRLSNRDNNNPIKIQYITDNGDISQSWIKFLFYAVALFSLFPLIGGLNIKWYFSILIELLATNLFIPFLVFPLYPLNAIYGINKLKIIGIICSILGIILYFIAK